MSISLSNAVPEAVSVPFLDLKSYHNSLRADLQGIWDALLSTCAFVGGPHVREFEENFAAFCGARHAIGVANGTDAITLAVRALGIGRGEEVIIPANSFVATAEAVLLAGATPVFADIDASTYTLDVHKIERHINSRTKAIIPVHLYGQTADMDPIMEIARNHNLLVIEDAAQAHGAKYGGRPAGSFGNAACFSFYPGKNLGACGDGGAVVTDDEAVAHSVRLLRDHGGVKKYQHEVSGHNSRLDTLQAAILKRKLQDLPARNRMRQSHAVAYNGLLAQLPGIVVPEQIPAAEPVHHLYVIRVERGDRSELQQFLENRGIQTGIHYPRTIPDTPAFARFNKGECPVATKVSGQILSLPMYPELTIRQIEYVAAAISDYITAVQNSRCVQVPH